MRALTYLLSSLRKTPNALKVSDWLDNMNDAFLRQGKEVLDTGKSSPEMLVFFTLTNTTLSANNILHAFPTVVGRIGPIYRELRAYYECLWTISLLLEYTGQGERIAKLHCDVDLRTRREMNSLFSDNPRMKSLLQCAFNESYGKRFFDAASEYIRGEGKGPRGTTENLLSDNQEALTATILRIGHLKSVDRPTIMGILRENTDHALRVKFLTQFDFVNCKFLVLPDEFYKSR